MKHCSSLFVARRWCLLLVAALMLSACGFHVRGKANLPFKSIYMGSPLTSPLLVELKRNLVANGVEVVTEQADAEARLSVLSTTTEQKVLTLNSDGRVREYELFQRFTFTVTEKSGETLLKPTTIVLRRTITYDPNQELAKQAEIVLLYRDMQSDTVQQVLRRLASIKPPVEDDTPADSSIPHN
ncbi:LPS assembly lipoprotein LptE [Herbaspirillum sp. RTI4]|uniref:LPS-assembly lipoprotein LptE n=1 Tax=Herbaspirillum sp. RTI4 TaxID=3048640 RepID=UPI002AB4C766|nr:LPS assembly lipoprotein LptE [Herbaspirillum sp. RTI4]MDY7576858.1 LPS assembly lipoprotein LptE [Herbaspirillum sp. RTI4]MEA9983495.1 LPS assembly lipoprotein LptE [Herbaspirillum sp. RTI4]